MEPEIVKTFWLHLFQKPIMRMKLSLLLVLALSSALTTEVVAQPTEKNQSSSAEISASSWTFLLETKTQWVFIFQEKRDIPVGSSFTNAGSIAAFGLSGGEEASRGNAVGNAAQPQNENLSAKQDEEKNSSVDAPAEGFVFEGNTDDIPSDEPPKPPGKKPKSLDPSAPTS